MILRWALALLLLANGVFFVWSQADRVAREAASQREPQRLAQQIKPLALSLMSPSASQDLASEPLSGLGGAPVPESSAASAAEPAPLPEPAEPAAVASGVAAAAAAASGTSAPYGASAASAATSAAAPVVTAASVAPAGPASAAAAVAPASADAVASPPARAQTSASNRSEALVNQALDATKNSIPPTPIPAASQPAALPAALAASGALPSGVLCLQTEALEADLMTRLRPALAAQPPALVWQEQPTELSARWIVYMGKFSDANELEKKRAQLRSLKVEHNLLFGGPLAPGLALGTFSSEAAADQGLKEVGSRGVRSARVVQERVARTVYRVRWPALTAAQLPALEPVRAALAGKKLENCAAPPRAGRTGVG